MIIANKKLQYRPTLYRIQCELHSKKDSTIKPSNRIQCQFLSKTDSTIKPTKRIKRQF